MYIKLLKNGVTAFLFISFPFHFYQTVFALTESEVQAVVSSRGKEAVSGNIFIWFLCAVAFLKISQKIDSFMSGLGVNVGRTGGSMMAEALIAVRSLGMSGKALFNKSGGGGSPSGAGSPGSGFLSGGLAGVVGRKINDSAMNAATDKSGGFLGKTAFESSLKNNGGYAKDIISKIATGDIGKIGSITGETADKALNSYLGYGSGMVDAESAGMSADTGSTDETSDGMTSHGADPAPSIYSETPPIENMLGIEEIATPSEPHTETGAADSGELMHHSDISTGHDVGSYPDTSSDTYVESSSEMNVSGEEQTQIPSDIRQADETHIPLSGTVGDTSELLEITPSYTDTTAGAEPVSQILEGQGSISGCSISEETADSTGYESIAAGSSVSVDPTPNTDTDMPAQTASGGIVQASSQEILNVPSVSAAPTASSPSVSNTQAQSNTEVNTAAASVNASTNIGSNLTVTQQDYINNTAAAPITADSETIGGMLQPELGAATQGTGGIPIFSNVEIGGGRITGTETSDKFPDGIEFGMYDISQYMKPQGDFTTVKTVDGVKWYKQYAAPSLEKTPTVEENGRIKYEEKIVNKMPPVPRRKDRV